MAFPNLDVAPGETGVFDEIEAERKRDFPREIDLGDDTSGSKSFAEHLLAFPKSDTPDGEPNVFDEIEAERKNRHLGDVLTGPPYMDDDAIAVMDEIQLERKLDVPREIDLSD